MNAPLPLPSRLSGNPFELSPGEIHFLWWFIQGSIMNPSTRHRLRNAWGLCERHAWGWLSVEAAFRQGYLHGPAVLYEELMGLALSAFDLVGPFQYPRLMRRLRERGPCLMCEEGYGVHSKGFVKPEVVEKGRNLKWLLELAQRTRPYWTPMICGKCSGNGSLVRCRKHLVEDEASRFPGVVRPARNLVAYLTHHLVRYAQSFRFEFRGTQTQEDEAALVSAIGWCSGWGAFLTIMKETSSLY